MYPAVQVWLRTRVVKRWRPRRVRVKTKRLGGREQKHFFVPMNLQNKWITSPHEYQSLQSIG